MTFAAGDQGAFNRVIEIAVSHYIIMSGFRRYNYYYGYIAQ